jgi:hypothetical protein
LMHRLLIQAGHNDWATMNNEKKRVTVNPW